MKAKIKYNKEIADKFHNYIHKGNKDVNYKKFLTEKGWKHISKEKGN